MSNPPEQPFQPPAPHYGAPQAPANYSPAAGYGQPVPPAGQGSQDQYPMQPQPSYYLNPSMSQQPMIYADSGPKGMSIASLVLGLASILGFGFLMVPQIIGVILGHLALSREPGGRGMAIAGLILNYLCFVFLIIGIVFFVTIFSASLNRYR